jgi:putative CocE/NonD family hydrolase
MKIVESFPNAFEEIENIWIPMPDGARLAARLWLPTDADRNPVPAVLEYIPYRKRDFMRLRDEPIHRYFAGHGYAAIRLDVRGSGDSDGVLEDEYSVQEIDDALVAIAWIADQPWCTGAVGMMGISWGGFNSLQVAARRPPALKAVITLCAADDRYADDVHYMGGCLLNENLQWGGILWHSNVYPPDPEIVGEDWRAAWRNRIEQTALFPALWLEHQRRDAYWRHGSVCEDFATIDCPVYAIGGWADGYSNAVPRLLAGLSTPAKGLVGPWAHTFPHAGVPGPAIGFLQEAVRWWDHWLKGEDSGLMDEPAYRVWMQDSVPPQPHYDERPGRWVAETAWPSPRIVPQRFFLNQGRLEAVAGEEVAIDFLSPQSNGLGAGNWCGFGSEGDMPIDQRADDGKSLVFDSDPLDEPLEILGAPEITLDLAVDQPTGFVAVRLNDVAPDGASTRVTYGLLNLTHRDGHDKVTPMPVGERVRVAIRLNDIAHAFPTGNRLRLAVSTSYWPIAWPSPSPVTLTVFAGASFVDLPVRPAAPEDAGLRPFEPPERAAKEKRTTLFSMNLKRSVERDLTTDETVYTLVGDGGELGGAALVRIEAIDLEVGYTQWQQYRIRDSDPLSAAIEMRQTTVMRRREWSIRIVSRLSMTADPERFRIEGRLETFDGDDAFVVRDWDERIPRDGI